MRRLLIPILVLGFSLIACTPAQAIFGLSDVLRTHFGLRNASSIIVDGVTYRSGFYDDGCGFGMDILGEAVTVDGQEYNRVNGTPFSMVFLLRGSTGDNLEGTLYCAEDQWDAAHTYYADGANNNYLCQVGVGREAECRNLPDMDSTLFERLMAFAAENAYDPFGPDRSAQLLHLPLPDPALSEELIFYRVSTDGCIISHRGYHFRSFNGQLLMLYYYDCGHGTYEEMVAVAVPDELAGPVLACLGDI